MGAAGIIGEGGYILASFGDGNPGLANHFASCLRDLELDLFRFMSAACLGVELPKFPVFLEVSFRQRLSVFVDKRGGFFRHCVVYSGTEEVFVEAIHLFFVISSKESCA